MKRFSLPEMFATWFYVGKIPFMPGTFGTLAAMPLAYGLYFAGGTAALLVAALLVTIVGSWASAEHMRKCSMAHDPGEIVIDEVAGLLLLVGLWQLFFAAHFPVAPLHWMAGSFVMFRVFDILKPWPISLADKKIKGGFGVMLDDLLAGLYPIAIFYLLESMLMLSTAPEI
jgi:phosphatidylglycerophosphatase A